MTRLDELRSSVLCSHELKNIAFPAESNDSIEYQLGNLSWQRSINADDYLSFQQAFLDIIQIGWRMGGGWEGDGACWFDHFLGENAILSKKNYISPIITEGNAMFFGERIRYSIDGVNTLLHWKVSRHMDIPNIFQ